MGLVVEMSEENLAAEAIAGSHAPMTERYSPTKRFFDPKHCKCMLRVTINFDMDAFSGSECVKGIAPAAED